MSAPPPPSLLTHELSPDDGSAVLVSGVRDDVEVRSPELKLSLPVDDGWQRSADQERTFRVALWYAEDSMNLKFGPLS